MRPHPGDLLLPSAPRELGGPRKAVQTDRIDVFQDTALTHQIEPTDVHRPRPRQHSLPASLARPIGRAAYHLAEDPPFRIDARIPFGGAVGLVPKLHPFEVRTESRDHHVYEVGISLGRLRWRGELWHKAKRSRRIEKTREDVDVPRQPRQQPGIPAIAFGGIPIGPIDRSAEFVHAERAEIFQHRFDPRIFAGPEPFHNAEHGGPPFGRAIPRALLHTMSPRAASSARASIPRSTAV